MFTIVRRPTPANTAALLNEWEPYRLMDSLLRWEPTADKAAPRRDAATPFSPRFDVKETKDAFLFKADLPGVKQSDIDISLSGNKLTITGKREAEAAQPDENVFMSERTYGSFSRTFTLPTSADVENIKADLTSGVLSVSLPKRVESQPRKITVGTSAGPS